MSLWRVLLACPAPSVSLYCISGLSATWSSLGYSLPGDHVTQTTTPPLSFYISLTHSLALFFPPLVTHCHSLFYLLYSPWLAPFFRSPSSLTALCSLTFVPSPPNYSFIRFGKPLTSPLLSPPSTAEHPLEHSQKKQKTESHCAQPYSTQR